MIDSPKYFYKMIQKYKEAQLLFNAIQLDIFTYLGEWVNPSEIVAKTGYNLRNLKLFLNSLVAIGLVQKEKEVYKNTEVVDFYLNKNRELYLGEYILFREEMTQLTHVQERVKNGPIDEIVNNNKGVEVYDFYKLARLSIPEMYTGRVQSLLKASEVLFNQEERLKILDLGGGSGVLVMELANKYPNATGVVFEHPSVSMLPRQLIKERGLENRIQVISGDFTIDSIGEGYDFIIASGILDFAKDSLSKMVGKLYDALKPSGYMYLVSHDVSEDYTSPKESIVGWLSSHLDGLDVLLNKKSISSALDFTGFRKLCVDEIQGIMDNLQGELYIKG